MVLLLRFRKDKYLPQPINLKVLRHGWCEILTTITLAPLSQSNSATALVLRIGSGARTIAAVIAISRRSILHLKKNIELR